MLTSIDRTVSHSTKQLIHTDHAEGKAEGKPPPPLRRRGVDSPHLPACIFHAPGDPAVIAPEEGR